MEIQNIQCKRNKKIIKREQRHMEKIDNSKMMDFNITTSVVTLNINDLKSHISVRDHQIE